MLLHGGVDVDSLNGVAKNGDGGNTALWFAAQGPWPDGLPIVRLLVESGADINRQCEHGRTALHMAAAWGHLDVVKYLVDHGAHVTIRAEVDGTPAEMARARNKLEVSKLSGWPFRLWREPLSDEGHSNVFGANIPVTIR